MIDTEQSFGAAGEVWDSFCWSAVYDLLSSHVAPHQKTQQQDSHHDAVEDLGRDALVLDYLKHLGRDLRCVAEGNRQHV